MKIFGINFETKKELKHRVSVLELDLDVCEGELEACEDELKHMKQQFPFDLCQVVYDVALKNAQGRYTKTKPSLEHSTITEVTVDEKNYFKLVERLRRNDVFFDRESAESYLKSICK
jgi:hypothetical protein